MELFLISLATYGLTIAITESEGPFGIFGRLQDFGQMFDCFICCSFWVAGGLSLLVVSGFKEWFLLTLASAGASIAINEIADF